MHGQQQSAIVIPPNTIMRIADPALDCLGLFGAIGRVRNVVDVDLERKLWLDFELTDAFDPATRNRVVLNMPDTVLDYCDEHSIWAERKRRKLYERATS